MTLPYSRLARLERSSRGGGVEQISRRCDEGTATLEEMATVVGDWPERVLIEDVLPYAKEYIDKVRSGAWCDGLMGVVAYPPGEALPDEEQTHLDFVRHLATYTQEDVRTKVFGNPTQHWLNPTKRLAAAAVVLGFGDDGERARSAVWERTRDGWAPSPAVLAAALERLAPPRRPTAVTAPE